MNPLSFTGKKLWRRRVQNKLVNVGFENVVPLNRIVAVVSSNTKPIKRLIAESKNLRKLIDATEGRKTRTVIITDSDHLILSSLNPKTLIERMKAR
jgi:regulator of extracellular matrix RemA (YlzA/DUF370 family)